MFEVHDHYTRLHSFSNREKKNSFFFTSLYSLYRLLQFYPVGLVVGTFKATDADASPLFNTVTYSLEVVLELNMQPSVLFCILRTVHILKMFSLLSILTAPIRYV